MIATGFGKEFSEPPNVTVSAARTHCEACQEPLDPNVMHKCHGNKQYEPPVFSWTEITELCPACMGEGVLVERETFQAKTFVVVCKSCRTYVWPEVAIQSSAISYWNAAERNGSLTGWPKWLAHMPGDDERSNVVENEVKPAHPDLANYQGACPAVHVEGEICDWCENTGTIPPTRDAK